MGNSYLAILKLLTLAYNTHMLVGVYMSLAIAVFPSANMYAIAYLCTHVQLTICNYQYSVLYTAY